MKQPTIQSCHVARLPLEPGTPVTAVVLVTATNHVKLQVVVMDWLY